ncbi:MAG: hypothetical protein NTW83_03890, partial [Cyanobacteria bacterium]|nr:hypothetical protein [Cyanobacteriota bacterium]
MISSPESTSPASDRPEQLAGVPTKIIKEGHGPGVVALQQQLRKTLHQFRRREVESRLCGKDHQLFGFEGLLELVLQSISSAVNASGGYIMIIDVDSKEIKPSVIYSEDARPRDIASVKLG